MKTLKLYLTICAFMVSANIIAQGVTPCGYIIPKKSLFKNNFQSVYEARDLVKQMLDTIKWKENFTLQEKNGINNAYATIINNRRWIIYDNDFLENIDEYAQTKWASISIMAHEMGHHKLNHVLTGKGSTVPTEIEADEFSGYMMYRLGANLAQSIAAIKTIASDKASATHPAKNDRVTAITAGWNRAQAESKKNTTNPTTGGGNTTGTKPPTGGNTSGTKPPTGGNTSGNKPPATGNPTSGGSNTNNPSAENDYISLSMQNLQNETIMLSDDGKTYTPLIMQPNKPFNFQFEVYKYGWLKLKYYNGYRIYKLLHGKDYAILWNQRKQTWSVVEVPE